MSIPPLRSLPRLFLPGCDPSGPIELPAKEYDKFRKVLRLESGDEIAILPNDGSLIRCELAGRSAVPKSTEWPGTESKRNITLIQALPKGERLETVLRMGTELGVSKFVVFQAIRSIAKWDPKKLSERFARFESILREAAEQSFRCMLPTLEWHPNLQGVLKAYPNCVVLSELESEAKSFAAVTEQPRASGEIQIVIGPEGGWDPREVALFGERGVTLGPLVLRTDTAGIAAAALLLLAK